MSFDTQTRNRLARFVAAGRKLLCGDFNTPGGEIARLLAHYGIQVTGECADLDKLPHLDERGRETARTLRAILKHKRANAPAAKVWKKFDPAVYDLLQEQGFTVLNRLCALRMAEERQLVFPCVSKGLQSDGFQLYEFHSGKSGDANSAEFRYQQFLFSLFDELSLDLGSVFDRFSPQGILFPAPKALGELLEELNHTELSSLWSQDETIGWIYQYWNSKDERKAMRDASAAPRNSRELAVRNQFFTPRYVVEFLTDNTLGRIWYEMSGGATSLKEKCRYLVRRPDEVFLGEPAGEEVQSAQAWLQAGDEREPDPVFLGHTVNGYARLGPTEKAVPWMEEKMRELTASGGEEWTTQKLLDLLFCMCRNDHFSNGFLDCHSAEVVALMRQLRTRREISEQGDLSQEELLKQPVFVPHRPLKDPREIRLLDPACGSMHFGLYAFDLFETIYEEAWELEEVETAVFSRPSSLRSLHESYNTKDEFLRQIPRLIIEHNIHGVDIDPRAAQIAGLSLWLRAQRAWRVRDIKPTERPRVRRSNIVCAEPMPGSPEMLEDFAATLHPPLLGELVKTVFDKMQLAGEAGTLLKIEEEIRDALDSARSSWEKLQRQSPELFSTDELNRVTDQPELSNLDTALRAPGSQLTGDFFDTAEERIYAALRDYAESAEAGDYQRRLFAEDAAHGFAFIDLCRQRYDVAVMNPPFGDSSKSSKGLIDQQFKLTKNDLASAFAERITGLLSSGGILGILSTRTWLFSKTFAPWRVQLLERSNLRAVADLGYGVLEAVVETAACVWENSAANDERTGFISALQSSNKAEILRRRDGIRWSDAKLFLELPNSVISYWVPEQIVRHYLSLEKISDDIAHGRQGLATADNFRFFRLAWEIEQFVTNGSSATSADGWVLLAKGGEYRPFYDDIHLTVNWFNSGAELKSFIAQSYPYLDGKWEWVVKNSDYYFRPGLTWNYRTTSAFCIKVLPQGCIFSDGGWGLFPSSKELFEPILALFNSNFARYFIEIPLGQGDSSASGTAARNYVSAVIKSVPCSAIPSSVGNLVSDVVDFQRLIDSNDESSRLFLAPLERRFVQESLSSANILMHRRYLEYCESALEKTLDLELMIERSSCFSDDQILAIREQEGAHPNLYQHKETSDKSRLRALYEGDDSSLIEATSEQAGRTRYIVKKAYHFDRKIELLAHLSRSHPAAIIETAISDQWLPVGHLANGCASYLSYAAGCVLSRWDIRYATGERQPPELPNPFDPLPVCPPGMLQNADGLPAAPADVPDDYPLRITWPGILVSDPGHPEDIVARVCDALAVIWGDRSAAIEQEACEILGVRTLRDYFAEKKSGGKFFKDHLKRYSKSRRQAPIYWPLSTESGAYTLWIYYHRLNENTLYSAVTQFIEPRQEEAQKTLNRLNAEKTRSKQEDKELETAQVLVAELATFRESLLEIAKFWKPNLNDGVQITAAPLWKHFRLVAWQKKLKETWKKLEEGEYDWAHLAHTIWPERVIPKCAEDRSLAIAHGHEDALWEEVENERGKLVWQPKADAYEIAADLVKQAENH
jgi:hypothetical protein